MTLENLKDNVRHGRKIVEKLIGLYDQFELASPKDQKIISRSIESLSSQLKILNNSVLPLVKGISIIKKLPTGGQGIEKLKDLTQISYLDSKKENVSVTINEKDRKRFEEELSLSKGIIKKLKKLEKHDEKRNGRIEFRKPSTYAKISNRFFFRISDYLIKKFNFKLLDSSLRRANMPFLHHTYLSIIFFSTFLALVGGILVFILLFAFTLNLLTLVIIPGLPLVIFILLYFYPSIEGRQIEKRINQELPFVSIHMAAIAGSGIEPSQIFKIIALSKEYKYTGLEIRKIINQINIYGYDLVNALKNTAKSTSSKKLSELLSGLATTINSGGSLEQFLEKRSESLLFDYKLERDKFTKIAETFMDIYISIVVAAPLILMMLLVLIGISGLGTGLDLTTLTFIIILVVALINVMFLIFLHIKQPQY